MPIGILREQSLTSDLNFRLLIWRFMYSQVDILSPAFSFEMEGKQRSNRVCLCCQQICTQSDLCFWWEGICGQCFKQTLFSEIPFLSTSIQLHCQLYFQKNCSKSLLKNARSDLSITGWIQNFCVALGDNSNKIQFSLCLCGSWMSVSMAWTKSAIEGRTQGSINKTLLTLSVFFIEKH